MKILHIGDFHTGIKKDDPWIENIIRKTIRQAVDYSVEHGIKVWIQAGDFFDVRGGITHRTMEFIRTDIVPLLRQAGIECYVDVGNHDCHFKNTIQPNAPRECLAKYECFHVIDKPTTVSFDGVDAEIDIIPWMCESNIAEILEFVKNSHSQFCVGHWELDGFYYYKNIKASGYKADFLDRYTRVISGHYHTQSKGGNVQYIGTPYTLTANDENEERGFWVHDLVEDTMDFIPNEKMYHVRLDYPGNIDPKQYTDCSVRLVASVMDKGLTELEEELAKYVHELRTVNDAVLIEASGNDQSEEIKIQSVWDVITEQIENSMLDAADKEGTLKIARTLYAEAVNMK